MLKTIRKIELYLISALAVVLAAVLFTSRFAAASEDCVLCGGLKSHAPCVVNLATGEVGELAIYEPHPALVGEISGERPAGTLAFLPCAGQTAVRDGDAGTCSVDLPALSTGADPQYFCKSCQKLLTGMEGYALVDRYDLSRIRAYPVEDGAVYAIRDYAVRVEWDGENARFNVVIQILK